MIADNVILYAQWKVNTYSLDFNLNGGVGNPPANQSVNYGEKADVVAEPVRDGYTFKGWNTIIDGTGISWDFNLNTMPAKDITLYAQWDENENPVPPTPGPNPGGDTIGQVVNSGLPKTGGFQMLAFGLLTLGAGLFLGFKTYRKK